MYTVLKLFSIADFRMYYTILLLEVCGYTQLKCLTLVRALMDSMYTDIPLSINVTWWLVTLGVNEAALNSSTTRRPKPGCVGKALNPASYSLTVLFRDPCYPVSGPLLNSVTRVSIIVPNITRYIYWQNKFYFETVQLWVLRPKGSSCFVNEISSGAIWMPL